MTFDFRKTVSAVRRGGWGCFAGTSKKVNRITKKKDYLQMFQGNQKASARKFLCTGECSSQVES